jgi:hypothetical protein
MNKEEEERTRSLEAWRGDTAGLSLEPEDLELVDNVLSVIPELRAVAFLGREARRRRLAYPVSGVEQLVALLRGDTFQVLGHLVDAESITEALPEEWFPLAHEGELLSAIHLGLRRCQAERAEALLDELRFHRATGSQKSPKDSKKTNKR